MNSRQRVKLAFNHTEPDRVPMDLGGTAVSTIRAEGYAGLLEHLGLPPAEPNYMSRTYQTVEIPESVRRTLRVDFLNLRPDSGEVQMGSVKLPDSFVDEWGVRFGRPYRSTGAFFPVEHPLQYADLDTILGYPMPNLGDASRFKGVRELARQYCYHTDYAIVGDGLWSILQQCYNLRGMDRFLMDMAADEVAACTLLERVTEAVLANVRGFLERVGGYIDVVSVGDDLGIQNCPIMSPAMYRRCLKRFHRMIVDEIRLHTDARILLHSDGSIYQLLPDIVDVGFQIINPVQASARHMDTKRLKQEFGSHLSFWGAVDTQSVLPRGTTSDVEDEVKRRIDDLAPGGGFVLAAVHCIQGDVPAENICTMFESGYIHGRYL